ncbi:MAG: hypothetical protein PHY28_01130 [Dehalococcoidales bacterium]|nr:hypothetical protein [Dehalococcoidales bacterium]
MCKQKQENMTIASPSTEGRGNLCGTTELCKSEIASGTEFTLRMTKGILAMVQATRTRENHGF